MILKRNLISGLTAAAIIAGSAAPTFAQSGLLGLGPTRPLSAMPTAAPAIAIRVAAAAVVNDEVISTYDLQQRMQYMILTTGVEPTQENMPEIQLDALAALIDERLEAQELKRRAKTNKKNEMAFFAESADVTGYLTDLARENQLTLPQFMQQMTSRGLTEKTIRDQIRIQLSWRDFIRNFYSSRVRIGDDQVKQALERIGADASKPSYETGMIFIDATHAGGQENAMASANQRMQQLQQGARFEALARQFSSLPTAANGGETGWLSAGEFPPAVEAVLPTMHQNEVRPVPVQDGVYLVMLHEKRAGGAGAVVTLKQAAIPLAADASPATVQAAQAKLMALKVKLNGCSNIEQQAQAAGLDADDLGESNADSLAPAFRDAVKTLKAGQVSNPVRSGQGMHLLAICDSHAAGAAIPSKDDIKNRLQIEQLTMLERVQLRDLHNAATIAQP